jgi:hypothetical protein
MIDYNRILSYKQMVALEKGSVAPKSLILSSETNPDLIAAVTDEMHRTDAHLVLNKLIELEKAIYHIANKMQDITVNQKVLEELTISTATTVEEILNGMNDAINEEYTADGSDEELVEATWETKKAPTPLN